MSSKNAGIKRDASRKQPIQLNSCKQKQWLTPKGFPYKSGSFFNSKRRAMLRRTNHRR